MEHMSLPYSMNGRRHPGHPGSDTLHKKLQDTQKKYPFRQLADLHTTPKMPKQWQMERCFFMPGPAFTYAHHRVRVYACGMLKKCVCQRKPTRSSMPTQGLDEFHIRKGSTIDKKMRSSPWTTLGMTTSLEFRRSGTHTWSKNPCS